MRLNRASLLVYAVLLLILAWRVAEPMWAYLVLGILLAMASYPLFRWLNGWIPSKRWAATLTLAVVTVAVIVPLTFFIWQIVLDMRVLVANLRVATVEAQIQGLMLWSSQTFGYPATVDPNQGQELIARLVPEIQSRLAGWITAALTSLGIVLIGIFVMILTAYYGILQGPAFLERLKRASPMDDALEQQFIDAAQETIEGVLLGQAVTALLQGGLGYLAFFIADIPNPFFWAFVMAILSFLPLVGAFLVWAPAAVFLFASGSVGMGIFMIVWGVAVISTVDNIVKPIIIGKRGALHPLLAFIGVLGGLVAFGFIGFVMGPLVLALAAAIFNVLADTGWDPTENLGGDITADGDGPGEGPTGDGSPAEPG